MLARNAIRLLLPAVLVLAAGAASAADAGPLPVGRDTLKARLGDKASDEQRVNDCRVPVERRGGSKRLDACAVRARAAER